MFSKYPNRFFRLLQVLFLGLVTLSCSTGSSSNDEMVLQPSNLKLDVEVIGSTPSNPNGDGTGKVILNFSAENATSYKINFGDGQTKETSANSISYTYSGSGTTSHQVYVSAYNADKFISTEKSVKVYIAPDLIWADEFNTDGVPDSSKWGYDLGAGGWGNNEEEYYTSRAENAKIENGFLNIILKKEDYQGSQYTSARLKTQGKFSFKYGKIEVRAKLPEGAGTWPAIWMLGSNVNTVPWPGCGEIDIMEEVGNDFGNIHSTLHTPSSFGNSVNTATTRITNVASEFHIYSAEWNADKIVFAVDGNAFYTYNPANKNSDSWPFDSNQFIILNVAMGGNFGGAIDPNFVSSTMQVDYVRVYR